MTVVLLTCSYREREFIRIGYYVNNEYDTEELRENNPMPPQLDRCAAPPFSCDCVDVASCVIPTQKRRLACACRPSRVQRVHGVLTSLCKCAAMSAPHCPDSPCVRVPPCRLYRNILADHPRVTKFPIEFDNDVAPAVDGATAPQAFGAPSYGQPAAMFDVAPQQSAVVGEPEAMET